MASTKFLEFTEDTIHGRSIKFRKNHLIVQFKQFEFHTAPAARLLDTIIGPGKYQLVGKPIGKWTYLWVDIEPGKLLGVATALHQHPATEFAEPDLPLIPAARPNDPMLKDTSQFWQWGPEYMGMFEAWDIQAGTSDVVIGLLDSGVPLPEIDPVPVLDTHASLENYLNHEDLDGKRFLAGMDFVNNRVWPRDDYETTAHGTQMAGIIAAKADNTDEAGTTYLGTAGINWGSPVYAFKAQHLRFGDLSETPEYASTAALFYFGIKEVLDFALMSDPPKKVVINVSAVFEEEDPPLIAGGTLKAIFELVLEHDIVICCGAGATANTVRNPAEFGANSTSAANVVVVGAVDRDDRCKGDLGHGFEDMVYAPGVDVGTLRNPTVWESDLYVLDSGTSHATAHVSALVANMWSEAPHMTAAEIVHVLKTTCRPPKEDSEGRVMESFAGEPGHGIVQAYEAMKTLKPRICLVLDKSGSMSAAAGIGGKARLDILKTAAGDLVDLVDIGSSLGLVSFDSSAEILEALKLIEITDPSSGASASRTDLQESINGLTEGGSTSIGAGVKKARSLLAADSPPQAIIVLTDGQENHSPYLSSLPSGPGEIKVFAVGMGTAESLQPDGLMTLAEDTDGYVVLDDQFAEGDSSTLSEFLGQIIAEVSAAETVADPAGEISPGEKPDIPFLLGETDARAEIILLRPAGAPIDLEVFSPDGNSWTETLSSTSANGRISRCRFSPPGGHVNGASDFFGEWKVVLDLPSDDFAEWIAEGGEGVSSANGSDPTTVPYRVWVNARSRLGMKCRISQSGYTPGSSMTLNAELTSGGKSIPWTFIPEVSVTGPSQDPIMIEIDSTNPNRIEFTIIAKDPGIYHWYIVARETGETEISFQRERKLTGAVWSHDGPGAPGQPHLGDS